MLTSLPSSVHSGDIAWDEDIADLLGYIDGAGPLW
jgi:hypothetical protein